MRCSPSVDGAARAGRRQIAVEASPQPATPRGRDPVDGGRSRSVGEVRSTSVAAGTGAAASCLLLEIDFIGEKRSTGAPCPTPRQRGADRRLLRGARVDRGRQDAVDPADLPQLEDALQRDRRAARTTLAFDWAWEKGTEQGEQRDFKILQSSPTIYWPELNEARFRLVGDRVRLGADAPAVRVLVRPVPGQAAAQERADPLAPGRGLLGPQPRRARHHVLDAVPRRRRATNGCMHFIDGGHSDGVLEHRQPPRTCRATCSTASPTSRRAVACPIRLGGVTFHHGKTPHMTPANMTDAVAAILTQHLRVAGTEGEGDHYPWKVYVNQFTGERVVPHRDDRRVDRASPLADGARRVTAREVAEAPARFDGAGGRDRPALVRATAARRHRARQVRPRRRQAGRHVRLHGHAVVVRPRRATPSTVTPAWPPPATCCSPVEVGETRRGRAVRRMVRGRGACRSSR